MAKRPRGALPALAAALVLALLAQRSPSAHGVRNVNLNFNLGRRVPPSHLDSTGDVSAGWSGGEGTGESRLRDWRPVGPPTPRPKLRGPFNPFIPPGWTPPPPRQRQDQKHEQHTEEEQIVEVDDPPAGQDGIETLSDRDNPDGDGERGSGADEGGGRRDFVQESDDQIEEARDPEEELSKFRGEKSKKKVGRKY